MEKPGNSFINCCQVEYKLEARWTFIAISRIGLTLTGDICKVVDLIFSDDWFHVVRTYVTIPRRDDPKPTSNRPLRSFCLLAILDDDSGLGIPAYRGSFRWWWKEESHATGETLVTRGWIIKRRRDVPILGRYVNEPIVRVLERATSINLHQYSQSKSIQFYIKKVISANGTTELEGMSFDQNSRKCIIHEVVENSLPLRSTIVRAGSHHKRRVTHGSLSIQQFVTEMLIRWSYGQGRSKRIDNQGSFDLALGGMSSVERMSGEKTVGNGVDERETGLAGKCILIFKSSEFSGQPIRTYTSSNECTLFAYLLRSLLQKNGMIRTTLININGHRSKWRQTQRRWKVEGVRVDQFRVENDFLSLKRRCTLESSPETGLTRLREYAFRLFNLCLCIGIDEY
ncbi:hypothetical protein WN51_13984 [Melipona quadrifasciata]|uniref:Uncharacterized protein n=1 Tax=Melipona quadrifasciata TaxID=166423 RepID=A0A0M9A0K8_9HYME|nr:hypothetical protein WN51_13984 [Melipona quadrifasciata]